MVAYYWFTEEQQRKDAPKGVYLSFRHLLAQAVDQLIRADHAVAILIQVLESGLGDLEPVVQVLLLKQPPVQKAGGEGHPVDAPICIHLDVLQQPIRLGGSQPEPCDAR